MAVETELRFTIAPDAAARIARLPPVRAAAHGRAVTRAMHSVYFDTPDHDLSRERVSLRLRREGGRWLQTVKGDLRSGGGLDQRHELETHVEGRELDHAALVGSGVSDVFVDAHKLTTLKPVFEAEFKRTARPLDLGQGRRAELAVDVGFIRAGDARAPISELELELESGRPGDLVDFALELLDHTDFKLQTRSKARRGYALVHEHPVAPSRGDLPALTEEMPLGDAFHAIVSSCVDHLVDNAQGIEQSADVEFLHQSRIAIRRLRLAFKLFSDVLPLDGFQGSLATVAWLADDLGEARDWDVFTLETLPRLMEHFPADPGLERLSNWASEQRARANAQAREDVASKRYTRLVLELKRALLQEPWREAGAAAVPLDAPTFAEHARAMLKRRHRKVAKRGASLETLGSNDLHHWRRTIKRLRYASAFFGSLWPRKAVRRYLAALSELQDVLGSVNDVVVVERIVERWRQTEIEAKDLETIGLLRAWSRLRAEDERVHVAKKWDAFRKVERFWKS